VRVAQRDQHAASVTASEQKGRDHLARPAAQVREQAIGARRARRDLAEEHEAHVRPGAAADRGLHEQALLLARVLRERVGGETSSRYCGSRASSSWIARSCTQPSEVARPIAFGVRKNGWSGTSR
jgi:hypothetical protein